MRKSLILLALSLLLVLGACSSASGDDDKFPNKNIEFVAPATPGGGWDATARAIQKILKEEKIVEQSMTVVNKPGGSGEVGWQYLSKKDGHSLAINSSLLITNNLLGQSDLTYEKFTPIATLTTEWISVAVPNDSPYKTAGELMEQLKKDPSSVKIGIAPGLGNNDHLSFVQAAKTYGVDVTKLNFLVYESGGDVVTSLLGGHVDAATMAVSESAEQHNANKFKVLAVTSDERLDELPEVPTWKEQGVDMVFPHWRGILGPPDMTEEQIAYWDKVLSEMVETDAWKELLENNGWEDFYKDSSASKKFLAEQTKMYTDLIEQSGLQK
ncbi:tripartite tricarboxylate transporter substrate binding protein [Sporosarcina saromensis]|uniref:Tripartite tricarboxylate transporter substrate binding protein n=1 Tax=Sporosarcina saromensis TaxID=359365 RepID=A0ABU4G7R2_9BACL|nr:tripartite tricarboxylate transporter substrate binding protein [Sporosarcina saromensis]MDW0113023.1 tripartite tricarboxylate transporter substrate binding protein [Sporosarcina saromensis]